MKRRIISLLIALMLVMSALTCLADEESVATPESLYQAGEDAVDAMDYATALDYFQQAADQGSADAIRSIGNLYADGNGVEKDIEKAQEYWLRAVDLGNTKALLNLGNIYARGEGVEQDSEKARELYQKAIDLGDTDGYVSLGNMYYYGFGVEQDFAKAMEYWLLAADQDIIKTIQIMCMIGIRIRTCR